MTVSRALLIVERLGQANAERLASIAGGTRLNVPGNLANAGRLRQLLGDDLAVLVVLHFGDSRIDVPSLKAKGGDTRKGGVSRRSVIRLTKLNRSARQIAKELNCSERTVRLKRAQARKTGNLPQITNLDED